MKYSVAVALAGLPMYIGCNVIVVLTGLCIWEALVDSMRSNYLKN